MLLAENGWANSRSFPTCEVCQTSKPPAKYNNPELQAIRPSKPLELVTTDIMGPLNMTIDYNRYIMIIEDHFTKWMEWYPFEICL
jgi:hypothetical protein